MDQQDPTQTSLLGREIESVISMLDEVARRLRWVAERMEESAHASRRIEEPPPIVRAETREVLFTLPELIEYLKLSRSTIYNKVNSGEIPFLKAGGRLRFRKSAVDQWTRDAADKA